MSWEQIKFNIAVRDITGGNRKFQNSEYLTHGKFPIIDQSEKFIGGYTNNFETIKRNQDVVIFGDHTKAIKYVDFDFCLGADGVKVLEPFEKLNTKFFFYFLQTIKLPNVGYSRHYKFLKDLEIPLPPLATQKRIAEILDAADALRRKDQELLKKYDELAQAIFIDMFGDPVKNEKGWELKTISSILKMKAGNFISASEIHKENNSNLCNCYGGNGLRGYVKTSTHEGNYILIGRQGALCGNVRIATGKFYATEHAIVCSPIMEFEITWMYFLLKLINLNQYATGAAQPGLNVGTLEKMNIIFAPTKLQKEFSNKLHVLSSQKKLIGLNIESSNFLFNSLIQKAFKGELVA